MIHIKSRWTFRQFPMPSCLWRERVSILLILLFLFLPDVTVHASLKVEWKGERLSVLAERVPLFHVLQEVANQTGIEFRGIDVLQDNVSLNFSHRPLLESLRRLLAPANYVIIEKRSSEGAIISAQAVVIGRLTPLTSETVSSKEASRIENEQSVDMTSPGQGGVPLEDELTAAIINPDQRAVSLEDDQTAATITPNKGGVPLEDELTAAIINPDQPAVSLEDDRTADETIPEQAVVPPEDELTTTEMISLDHESVPLDDELTAATINPNQGGVPLEDELTAAMINPDQRAVSLEDDQTAATLNPDQGGVPLEDELAAAMINPDQLGVPLEDEIIAGAVN